MSLTKTSFSLLTLILYTNLSAGFCEDPATVSRQVQISSRIGLKFIVPDQFPQVLSGSAQISDLENNPSNWINKNFVISFGPGKNQNFDVYSNSNQEITITQSGPAQLQNSANISPIPFQIEYTPCGTNPKVININQECSGTVGCAIPTGSTTWSACNTSHGYVNYILQIPNTLLPSTTYAIPSNYKITFQANF